MKDQYRGSRSEPHEAIAIVGMACDYPGGSHGPQAFFDFLLKKKCGVVEIPEDRWGTANFYDPNSNAIAKSVSKWGGFIDGIRDFDATFFGISPREANGMDPQQRMVLQSVVEAMMDAGIPLEDFSRQSTGVFVGISQSEYRTLQEMRLTSNESYAGTGYALCIAANRVSHRLNLSGPSYAVDTACSSSLTALNQAVQNLRTGACDVAVVSGVNALTHPGSFVAFSNAGMISPTGRISTFDASANGFVRGEGVGTVVIKPLSRAQADGDRIHAVIEGTAVNQDGNTSTITAPSQAAQMEMLRQLFDSVDVRPDQIGFVEAHGTGTPIGDPIEAGAIGTVIGQKSPHRPVFVGSGKANIGHLESGAGVAGLIKAVMAVKTGTVPPNAHFKTANPNIPFDALNLQVPVRPEPFPEADGRRFAVVNSFGFGGANASALVGSAPEAGYDHHPVPADRARPAIETGEGGMAYLFPISGASADALKENAAALLRALGAKGRLSGVSLRDISAALATARSHLMYRAVVLARTEAELKSALRKLAAGEGEVPNVITGQRGPRPTVCFTFSGQGSQWWGMARDLLERNSVFSAAVDAFDKEFVAVAGWSIRAELLKGKDESRIDDTTVTQPALFAIQSGLAAVWEKLGVRPDMVAGHSIGEAAASYVAGGLSLSGAAKFLSKRGTIRDRLGARGAMAAIGLNHLDVEALLPLDGTLGIAAINGPGSTTISGDYDALHAFVEEFQVTRPDTFIRALTVDTAWHSYHLDAGEEWFRREMAQIDWSVPTLPFISTVTGKPETRFDTDYGWLNLRRPVRFQAGVEAAIELGADTFVELGPAATLAGPTRSTALEKGASVTVLNSINRKDDDFDTMARAAAQLFVKGYPLDWKAITGRPSQHVDLPANVWVKEPFWRDSEESRTTLSNVGVHPFLGMRQRGQASCWHSEINLGTHPYLKDHRMQSEALFPAAGYLDTMLAACRAEFGWDKIIELEDVVIHEALFISADQDVLFHSSFDHERGRIKLFSRVRDDESDWVLRSECRAHVTDVPPPAVRRLDPDGKGFKPVALDYVYSEELSAHFINYGPAFQTLDDVRMSSRKTWARLKLRDAAKTFENRHFLHPTLLDGCLQLLDPSMTLKNYEADRRAGDFVVMPIGAGRIRVYGDLPDEVIVESDQLLSTDLDRVPVGFTIYDLDGQVLFTVRDLRVKFLPIRKFTTESEEVPAGFVRQDIVEIGGAAETGKPKGRWVVLGNEASRIGTELTAALADAGAETRCIARSELDDDDVGGALADMLGDAIERGEIEGIVVSWPLAVPAMAEDATTDDLFAPIKTCTRDMIALGELFDYARGGTVRLPRIVFLTSGAYPGTDGKALDSAVLTQAPLATLVRGHATEVPEYSIRLIDADAAMLDQPDALVREILAPTEETELILRDGKRLAPRLSHVEEKDFAPRLLHLDKTDTDRNFHATMTAPGIIDQVELRECALEPVGPGQVRVRVSAVGLNFRDVMAVTGLLPVEAEPEPAWENLGLEFGAEVVEVGADVTGFKPGDRVMGMGRRCLQRFLTTDARALTLVPDHISLAEAATIPSAFATAHYALNHVGRMGKGDRVLIHVATGGVGTAAVQLAQAAGAEIFATAGSPQKRRILRDQGIRHIMDSRSLKFADDVMAITDGRGVDVLLNSLPGDYITKGLDIMAPYGRFLEIGKRDVYEDSSIGMKAMRRNVSFSVLDLAAMGLERPDMMSRLFAELSELLDAEQLKPLPLTEFPVSRISDAIRYMSQARHVGKVVVTLEEESFAVRRDETRPARLVQDGSYLVTGGTAGFSLGIADWLSQAGAGRLILASRSGKVAKVDERRLARMRKRGTAIDVVSLDIADSAAVLRFVADAQGSATPIRGVIHGAAVIKDGLANQLTPDMISDVLGPKIRGAWNLHRAFAETGKEPDFMIGFSSIAQVVGSAGQCNYIAANAFLDALAQYRIGTGKPGAAIDWGVVGDAGFVARNAALASYLESVGQFGLTMQDAQRAMEVAVTRDAPNFLFARADWMQIGRANASLGSSPRMSGLVREDSGSSTQIRALLLTLEGAPLVEAATDYIKDEICNVLKIEKQIIDEERPMSELGLDSLSSFELKVRVETALDVTIVVSKFLQAPTIRQLAHLIAEEIDGIRKAEAAAQVASETTASGGGQSASRQDAPASDLQIAMLRDSLSPLTSDAARAGMETLLRISLAKPLNTDAMPAVLRQIARRHPLVQMILEDGQIRTDGPGIALREGPDDRVLNVAGGEWLRLTHEAGDRGQVLTLRMHRALGDQKAAELLLNEIGSLLSSKELAKPPARRRVLSALAACRYDPENADCQTDRAFWWYALRAAKARPVPFKNRGRALSRSVAGRDHGTPAVFDLPLGGPLQTGTRLSLLARSLRLATESSGPVLIGRRRSLVDRLSMKGAIGPFETEQPLLVPPTGSNSAAMAQFSRVLARADDHFRFGSHAAVTEFVAIFAEQGISPFQVLFEEVADLSKAPPEGITHDLWVQVAENGGAEGGRLRVIYDREVVTPEIARRIAEGMVQTQGQLETVDG